MFGGLVAWETGLALDNRSAGEDTQVMWNSMCGWSTWSGTQFNPVPPGLEGAQGHLKNVVSDLIFLNLLKIQNKHWQTNTFQQKKVCGIHGEEQIPWERQRVGDLREFLLSTGPSSSEESSVGWEGSFGQSLVTVAREARPETICPAYSRCALQALAED